jgi:putative alpha-1,2-mannosidase
VRNRPGCCALKIVGGDAVAAEVVLAGLRLFFCARFRGDVANLRLFSGGEELDASAFSSGGPDAAFGCVADFGTAGAAEMLVSISPFSMEKAVADCRAENRSFEEIRASAREKWNEALSAIEIETDDPGMERLFYSNLYHTLTKPSDWSGENFIAPGEERLVLDFATLWDQYKTQMPLLFTLYPDISQKILSTILSYTRVVGHLPHQLLLDGAWKEKETVQARALAAYLVLDAFYRSVPGDYGGLSREIGRDSAISTVSPVLGTEGEKLTSVALICKSGKSSDVAARLSFETAAILMFERL